MTRKRNGSKKCTVKAIATRLLLSLSLFILILGCAPTTVLVLRHAERPPGDDPPLSPAGQQRAQELVQVAGEAGVTAIYATQFIRTQQTAQPLADHLGLDVNIFNVTGNSQQYADDLVDHILSVHRGEVVLILSHSHTVPLIVEALGAGSISAIPGNEYDNIFIVTVPKSVGATKILKAEYGEDSP
jgi:broad specificity phosphatase PhoE